MQLPPNFSELDFWEQVRFGKVPGAEILERFGSKASVAGTLVVLSRAGVYRTPSAPVALEAVSADATDAFGLAGAQQVEVSGIKGSWAARTVETFNLNGLTPVPLGSWLRVDCFKVKGYGSYQTFPGGPNVGQIDCREVSTPANIWASVDSHLSTPIGCALIGGVSVPTGSIAKVLQYEITVETAKAATVALQVRQNADAIASPFGSILTVHLDVGITDGHDHKSKSGIGPFTGPCDIVFCGAITAGTSGAMASAFEVGILNVGV